MEFDKSKVYTALNADELKVGSKAVFANTIADLKRKLENAEAYKDITELESIKNESNAYRFTNCYANYMLCYLVKEPEENEDD